MKMTTFVQLLIQVAEVNKIQGRQDYHPHKDGFPAGILAILH